MENSAVRMLRDIWESSIQDRLIWQASSTRGAYITKLKNWSMEILRPGKLSTGDLNDALGNGSSLVRTASKNSWRIVFYNSDGKAQLELGPNSFEENILPELNMSNQDIFKEIYLKADSHRRGMEEGILSAIINDLENL